MLFELRPISVSDATFGQKDSDGEEEGGDPSGYNCDHSSREVPSVMRLIVLLCLAYRHQEVRVHIFANGCSGTGDHIHVHEHQTSG
ncbi:hypothetical protein DPMN_179291 [Dreissena polymorpha]|uniref:Uncharacterized protein n=1 Tax=Dreissena polymorpha TaxID=45954 RepID=A0A9D4IND5_DREPO|nr:hypothetical protein DPMN_179291 [Dreissena polymorpha]